MRHVLVFLLIFLLCISPVTALAEAGAAALAEDVLASLAEGDFAAVFENSDAAMQEAVGDADGLGADHRPAGHAHAGAG